MSTDLVVVERSLDELAAVINREHASVVKDLWSAIRHAIAAGEAIYEAHDRIKAEAGGGKTYAAWERWVEENLNCTTGLASRYERLFFYQEKLPSEAFETWADAKGHTQQPSIARACSYLRGLPSIRPTGILRMGESE